LVLVLAGAALACYLFVLPLLNPLRRSEGDIAASLLEQTPPGTPREEVEALVRDRGWPRGGRVFNEPDALSVAIGSYHDFPFGVTVFACWRFDEQGRVRTVEVDKWVNNAP
jgi:hypothetical protein